MSRKFAACLAVVGLMVSGAVWSADYDFRGYDRPQQHYDWAQVIRVDPIIERYDRPIYRDKCRREPVVYRQPVHYRGYSQDRTPALLGAIVGGVVGSQFGSGHGRDAATAAGAILGYSAVRDDQRRQGGYYVGGREHARYEQRCTTQTHYVRGEQVTGYEVTYHYDGRTYRTVTDYDPGERIRVALDVRPAP
ncbi:MAG: glycine zipper 2TM domain-containing protein [Lysobacteraceae bacterium]